MLPPITPYYVMKVGHIPLIHYWRPRDPQVAQPFASLVVSMPGVLLERLGPVVMAFRFGGFVCDQSLADRRTPVTTAGSVANTCRAQARRKDLDGSGRV